MRGGGWWSWVAGGQRWMVVMGGWWSAVAGGQWRLILNKFSNNKYRSQNCLDFKTLSRQTFGRTDN